MSQDVPAQDPVIAKDDAKPKGAGGRPSRQRVAQINSALVRATLQAFARQGGDFSVDEVARLADVSKQTIYRRWPTKRDLLIHVIESVIAQTGVFETPEAAGEAAGDPVGDPLAALYAQAREFFDARRSFGGRVGTFLAAEAQMDDRLAERLVAWRARLNASLGRHLTRIKIAAGLPTDTVEDEIDCLIDLMSAGALKMHNRGASDEALTATFERRWRGYLRMIMG